MQTPAPTPAPAPAPIAVPPAPTVIQVTPVTPAPYRVIMPRNQREVEAIKAQRSVMSDQLINVRERRSVLAKQYENASGANRRGLESQLEVLDQRIVQLESELDRTASILRSPEVAMIGVPSRVDGLFRVSPNQITAMSIVFTIFVLFPVAIATARNLWRRGSRPVTPPGWTDATHRFERLEQAVDAIAIEMERVSEGQRYMTRIMTERPGSAEAASGAAGASTALNGQGQPPVALGSGAPEQAFVPRSEQEAERVRRR